MDYLELDDSAMQAFQELGGIDLQHTSSKPAILTPTTPRLRPRRRVEAKYLFRLENLFLTPRDIAHALDLPRVPQLVSGTAQDGEANFCQLSQSSMNTLDSWIMKHDPNYKFTKIRIGLAHKDAGELPILGRDPTLPQHRPHLVAMPTTLQHGLDEYPVHYFFYGTLADAARLERLFGIPASELPRLQAAVLLDGRIRTWGGKYRALVDSPGGMVNGFAYAITSVDQEDVLRAYEGDNYEVITATMMVDRKEIIGRSFRFAGFEDELTG
ncbi:hypothetical protein ACEQ8H_001174 [Pleosporales sp. CAS-2024a]